MSLDMSNIKSNLFSANSLTSSSSWSALAPLFIDGDQKLTTTGSIDETQLDTITTAGKVANSATSADTTGMDNKIVSRNGAGGFTAGTLTCSSPDVLIATAAGPQGTSSGTNTTVTGWSISTNLGSSPITESSGSFTLQKSGIYKITASTTFDAFNGGFRQIFVMITSSLATDSNVRPIMTSAYATYQWQRNITVIEKLNAGDTISIYVVQNGTATLNISNSTVQIVRIA